MDRGNKLIDGESLTAYERWELPAVEDSRREQERARSEQERARSEDVPVEEVEPITAEQIEAIQKQAYVEGYEFGRKEGVSAGQKEIHAEVQRLHQIINSLNEPLAEMEAEVEQELVQLAVAIARQLIRRELKTDPDRIVGVVREAVSVLPTSARAIKVHLHPEDAEVVRTAMPIAGDEEGSWRIMDDPALTRGGCRVVTDHSRVDASVEKRLAAVVADLLGGERAGDSHATGEE